MNNTTILNFQHKTCIEIAIGAEINENNGEMFVPVDFSFINRGAMTKLQVKKTMRRWLTNCLWAGAEAQSPQNKQAKKQAQRARRWNERNLQVLPHKQA